ncbi:hypothetical protein A4A49_17657 [Nicotiana attenuata]|uniref:Uncharacterized protein n=1 Tax=Nicotiana attenuata TaxID=49451 RepID=A0A314KNL1_NICAT|nr:hypothetical protein A4A49_17657 [Nicotiana attenuata]
MDSNKPLNRAMGLKLRGSSKADKISQFYPAQFGSSAILKRKIRCVRLESYLWFHLYFVSTCCLFFSFLYVPRTHSPVLV